MESKTARFTVLLDPRKKRMFEEICAAQDQTPSQVVRQLMREYIIAHAGKRELPAWLLKAATQRVTPR
jgi:Ribbon-helix-helix protein